MKTKHKTRTQILIERATQYARESGLEEIDLDAAAEWLVENRLYDRPPIDPVKQCRQELSRAFRAAHHEDPQGRHVRTMHSVRVTVKDGPEQKHMYFWIDQRTAKPKPMHISAKQNRDAIANDCRRHKINLDSYNDNNIWNATLPLFDYNFNPDIEEMDLPTEYAEDDELDS